MIENNLFTELLYNFGFPVFVVIWFMFRTEKILKENTIAINNLASALTRIVKN